MGYHSDLMIDMYSSPQLSGSDKTICANCVVDDALIDLVKSNLSSKSCSYCDGDYDDEDEESNSDELIAAPYDIVMERIYETIFQYYGDAQDVGMPWVEKEWLMPENNIWEIIGEFDPGWLGNFCEDLIDSSDPSLYLVEHVDNDWSTESPASALFYGWSAFKEQVLHKTRYLFLSEPEDKYSSGRPDYIPVSNMIDALGALCNSESLVKTIPAGTEFYRVRVNSKDAKFTTFSEVGVPPKGFASAGRMNPAGISYFYVAYDQLTAEKEVVDKATKWTIAKFETLTEITVIDFVNLPAIPSVFSEGAYETRQNLSFLHSLVKELTLPVSKDGMEHVEYVPTQIISEYFRHRFKTPEQTSVLGLRYPSVKNESGINIAIFNSDNDSLAHFFKLVSTDINC
ncbi:MULTISPECIES: HEPN-associated N-terminal domain-containing protein [unclassified Pseudoalteromonas]|uniref:HEPN-associated N-terminal domain-containing protein n=1 Tax=unclassified Pseudoalteromonas TaxID=194690 RepID=UPI000304B287|nr:MULTISPECIES: HEPN-associated N-terminal domain-containing protein [unclassified Pseudoalteromonas]KGK03157.1 RES domain protein [Pseudoalteromonas sp. ND6B]